MLREMEESSFPCATIFLALLWSWSRTRPYARHIHRWLLSACSSDREATRTVLTNDKKPSICFEVF